MTAANFINQGNIFLQQGNAREALGAFEAAAKNGGGSAAWLGTAAAHGLLSDRASQLDAIEKALAISPKDIAALIAKGDWFDADGEAKAAGSFYGTAISVASQQSQAGLSQQLSKDLQRAQVKCQQYAGAYEQHLRQSLKNAVVETNKSTNGAFNRSVDILLGKRQVYLQQPHKYYFPELPNRQFYDRRDFDWIDELDARTTDIKEELTAIIEAQNNFEPYVKSTVDTARTDHLEMFDNPDWSAFYLYKDGKVIEENAARCPKTMAAIEIIPLARIPGNSPSILFSLLRAGAKIPPHTGLINSRLICHLPLVVPDHCGFRVGNETREWVEGETWVFDDTIEHEAWNNSGKNRYVLIFDIEQPAMTSEEHDAVAKLFEAIETF